MRAAFPPNRRPDRRGVTLIEMLVVVALVVLMMTILASIFQAATGAISSSRTFQELDNNLRFLDMTIRQDLAGATARMTPPLNPALNLGYFEYGENAPADAQGEDTDDYIAWTCKAPEGQFYTGRVWLAAATNLDVMPVTITSQFAEVIYFLRNGNLYRRVLLILPERKGTFASGSSRISPFVTGTFDPDYFNGNRSSWIGVNDVSVRVSSASTVLGATTAYVPVPNTLGNLTNRENRFSRPRFGVDYKTQTGVTFALGRDGIPDDLNGDGIPDYYPTMTKVWVDQAANDAVGLPTGLMNEDKGSMPGGSNFTNSSPRVPSSRDVYAFPFIYPWMYSVAESSSVGSGLGWLHAFDPSCTAGVPTSSNSLPLNHAPLEFGDSLPGPSPASGPFQSWFGFPTWRETVSPNWRDPVTGVTAGSLLTTIAQQARGLQVPDAALQPTAGANGTLAGVNMLPPLGSGPVTLGPPFGHDTAGAPTLFATGIYAWEDDLIMTGVRSFDVKALDVNAAIYNNTSTAPTVVYNSGYYDLGYASTDYFRAFASTPALQTSFFYGDPHRHPGRRRQPPGFRTRGPDAPKPRRQSPRSPTPVHPGQRGREPRRQ